ncbi:hypothetical protein HanPSC8_Chr16g0710681 [Helianthus annuus]|nr:hypothetical protein HanPSC8_Chr16g0710681 [Helianthus annuus]
MDCSWSCCGLIRSPLQPCRKTCLAYCYAQAFGFQQSAIQHQWSRKEANYPLGL